jgi:UDP:flavonoid glycosyltransferase YjiC (YdhE family)
MATSTKLQYEAIPAVNTQQSNPRLVWIFATGTRGDIQPFVAVGSALAKSIGCRVKFFTNEDFVEFANSFGLEGAVLRGSNRDVGHADDPKRPLKSLIETNERTAAFSAGVIRAELARETPDLAVVSAMLSGIGWYLSARRGVPHIDLTPVADIQIPSLPFDLQDYLLGYQIYKIFRPFLRELDPDIEQNVLPARTYCSFFRNPDRPVIVMQSPTLAKIQYAHLKSPEFRYVGTTVIGEAEQTGAMFGGDTDAVRRMATFLDHPQKPIYLGWGSMKSRSPEHLVELCVRSVHHSQQRAIVLEGEAGLSLEALERAVPNDPDLLDYARANVLFVHTAPHEWLFSRLSATVHHGGAGTTTAALRSGVPTVIAPVLADQFDHSRLVNRLGVGIGLEAQINELSWQELGGAITRAVTDRDLRGRAAELGRQLRSEPNGANVAAMHIEEFWTHYCLTGRFWQFFPPPRPTASPSTMIRHHDRVLTGAILVGLASAVLFCLARVPHEGPFRSP